MKNCRRPIKIATINLKFLNKSRLRSAEYITEQHNKSQNKQVTFALELETFFTLYYGMWY